MKQTIVIAVAVVLMAVSVSSAAGVTWAEIDAGHSLTSHPKTGEPILTFTVWMEYNTAPRCMALRTEWTMSIIEDGSEEVLVTDVRPVRRSCAGIGKFFSLSPYVEAAPGQQYRGVLRLEDEANSLVYERSFDFVAPDPLPIKSVVKTPGALSDGIRSRLAGYVDTLSTDYRQTADAVSLAEFFSDYAVSEEDFPVMIFVASALDVGQTDETEEQIDRLVLFFTIPSPNTGGIVLRQLEGEDDDGEGTIVGRVFVRDSDSGLGAVTVFVHEAAWELLQAAREG